MGRPPGVEQEHALARLLKLLRRPGAEHAGADDDRVAMRRRGCARERPREATKRPPPPLRKGAGNGG